MWKNFSPTRIILVSFLNDLPMFKALGTIKVNQLIDGYLLCCRNYIISAHDENP